MKPRQSSFLRVANVIAADSPSEPEVSPEVLNQLREQIRAEERTRLSEQIEASQGRVERLSQELEAARASESEVRNQLAQANDQVRQTTEELTALRESVSQQGDKPTVDIEKLVKETAQSARKEAEAAFTQQLGQVQQQLDSLNAENHALKLQQYRDQAIAIAEASGKKLVREMVTGNTNEEIDASIERAAKAYADYFGNVAPQPVVPQTVTQPVTPPAPVGAPAPGTHPSQSPAADAPAGGTQQLVSRLKGRDGKEVYAQNREALKEAAAQQFARSGGSTVSR